MVNIIVFFFPLFTVSSSRSVEGEGNVSFQDLCATPMIRQPSHRRANGYGAFSTVAMPFLFEAAL